MWNSYRKVIVYISKVFLESIFLIHPVMLLSDELRNGDKRMDGWRRDLKDEERDSKKNYLWRHDPVNILLMEFQHLKTHILFWCLATMPKKTKTKGDI